MSKEKNKKTPIENRNSSLKIGLVCTLAIILIALTGYFAYTKISAYKLERKTMTDFNKSLNSEELSLVYYMHTGCQFCEMQEPILEQIAKDYNLTYITIDSKKISKSDDEKIVDILENEGRTPTLAIVKNGEVKAKNIGYLEGYKLVEFLVKSEILDEKSTYKPEEGLTFINYEEFKELKKNGTHVLVLGSATCDFCKAARPTLSNISKAYKIPIHYISLSYLTKEEVSKFSNDLKDMEYKDEKFVSTGNFPTPSLLVIKDGKVVSYLSGYQDSPDYVKYLKEQKIIKE